MGIFDFLKGGKDAASAAAPKTGMHMDHDDSELLVKSDVESEEVPADETPQAEPAPEEEKTKEGM